MNVYVFVAGAYILSDFCAVFRLIFANLAPLRLLKKKKKKKRQIGKIQVACVRFLHAVSTRMSVLMRVHPRLLFLYRFFAPLSSFSVALVSYRKGGKQSGGLCTFSPMLNSRMMRVLASLSIFIDL